MGSAVQQRRYRQRECMRKLRAARRKAGLCTVCTEPTHLRTCRACRDYECPAALRAEYLRQYRQRLAEVQP